MYLTFNFVLSVRALLTFLLVYGTAASSAELRSLLEFKKGISGDPLGKVQDSWNPSSVTDPAMSPLSWHGVGCNDAGNVVSIALDGLGLIGELKFFTLSALTMLRNLSLSHNFFSGRLVPAMGIISSLQYLDLSDNSFYGPIPDRINQLGNLFYLNLSSNALEGGLPNGIGNLQQLKFLDLHSNKLRGDIQSILTQLRNVEVVDLSNNSFYGSLTASPENISDLANTVRHMNLSHNDLSGEFFGTDSIALFRNLEVLDLSNNQIFGELSSIVSLTNVRVIHLRNNMLHGSIPEEMLQGSMPLVELDLSNNRFTGIISEINSTTLNILKLSSNKLSGYLPSSLKSCTFLDLSKNMLSGDIFNIQGWASNLEVLDLSLNNFTGRFPNLTFPFQNLVDLKIKSNSLVGTLPLAIGTYPKLAAVDLSLNKFDGPIPHTLFSSLTLKYINLSANQFTGAIPFMGSHVSELLVLSSYPPMDSLDLSGNYLTSSLPSDIGKLGRLTLLDLSRNRLHGKIPIEMSKLSELKKLDLSSNSFSGQIPDKLPSSLMEFNVSYNNLSGPVPKSLRRFSLASFHPGNVLLNLPNPSLYGGPIYINGKNHGSRNGHVRVAIISASIGVAFMIVFVLIAYHRTQFHGICEHSGSRGVIKLRRFGGSSSLIKSHPNDQPPEEPTSLHFSSEHLLTSTSTSLSLNPNFVPDTVFQIGSQSSPNSNSLLYNPGDRLDGQLFFLDASLHFTSEQLSQALAEVLGRSSHGTLYKANLEGGHVLCVKWLRLGLVRSRKDFAKEVKRIGSMRHPNIVPLRAYYWGPREQERLILSDYISGDSLAQHLYGTIPRRYPPLSFTQRLKVAADIARGLLYLHDQILPHGNLKSSNVLLAGPALDARIADYGLHRLMTPLGFSEQILNLRALGYCPPDFASKVGPDFKSDVYAFGVIVMEMMTKRSAGDIICGQAGAVDLTDWVRTCVDEGRGADCLDEEISGGCLDGVEELLGIAIRCVSTVNERPEIRQVFEEVCAILGGD